MTDPSAFASHSGASHARRHEKGAWTAGDQDLVGARTASIAAPSSVPLCDWTRDAPNRGRRGRPSLESSCVWLIMPTCVWKQFLFPPHAGTIGRCSPVGTDRTNPLPGLGPCIRAAQRDLGRFLQHDVCQGSHSFGSGHDHLPHFLCRMDFQRLLWHISIRAILWHVMHTCR